MAASAFRIVVLASGGGTNLQAILDTVHGREGIELVAVAGDEPEAPALERARSAGVEVGVFEEDAYGDRRARDAAMAAWLADRDVALVVLAGYMRLLSEAFLSRFPNRVINVHPALLPAFRGVDVPPGLGRPVILIPGFLAGDWTATGWPATMESAVRSGYLAAEALMRATGFANTKFIVPDLPASGLMRLFK